MTQFKCSIKKSVIRISRFRVSSKGSVILECFLKWPELSWSLYRMDQNDPWMDQCKNKVAVCSVAWFTMTRQLGQNKQGILFNVFRYKWGQEQLNEQDRSRTVFRQTLSVSVFDWIVFISVNVRIRVHSRAYISIWWRHKTF